MGEGADSAAPALAVIELAGVWLRIAGLGAKEGECGEGDRGEGAVGPGAPRAEDCVVSASAWRVWTRARNPLAWGSACVGFYLYIVYWVSTCVGFWFGSNRRPLTNSTRSSSMAVGVCWYM